MLLSLYNPSSSFLLSQYRSSLQFSLLSSCPFYFFQFVELSASTYGFSKVDRIMLRYNWDIIQIFPSHSSLLFWILHRFLKIITWLNFHKLFQWQQLISRTFIRNIPINNILASLCNFHSHVWRSYHI